MVRISTITILGFLSIATSASAQDINSCPLTSDPEDQSGTTLQTFADTGGDGVTYNDTAAALTLMREGGNFASQFHPNTEEAHSTCGADFDEDGWMDFIGVHSNSHTYWFFKNESYDNLPPGTPDPGSESLPPWNDPTYVLTPKFTPTQIYSQASRSSGGDGLMCADINNDGHQDFVYITGRGTVREARTFLGNGDGTFNAPYRPHDNWTSVFYGRGNNSNLFPVDYNGDGYMDFLFGDRETNKGSVQVFYNDQGLNSGGNGPQFTPGPFLITDAQMGTDGVSGIAYLDMNGNGEKDLLIGGDDSNKLKFYPGISGGTVAATPIVRNTPGSNGHVILVADFSLDGLPDLIVSTEHGSGSTHYIKNNGTAVPFSGAALLMDDQGFYDSDAAFAIDYDHDPLATLDAIISDGDHSGWGVYANQVVQDYVECGEVESGILSLDELSDEEMVITSARLTPTLTLPSGASTLPPVTFYMSNSTPINWVLAAPCIDDASAYCVSFDQPVGRDVRWKAVLCSTDDRQQTPKITGVELNFDYQVAAEHFRAGIVVNDGIAYVGSFKQPGDRGHFYAINTGFDTTYWDAAERLDAMADSERNVYSSDGTQLIELSTSNASASNVHSTLGVSGSTQASQIISWLRSARFGLGVGVPKTRLGSIETSTAGVLSRPSLPSWYVYADATEKSTLDTFVSDNEDRQLLVFFGSRDGQLHAIRNDPGLNGLADNGKEVWSYVPPRIASVFASDYTADIARADYPLGAPIATAYPDATPSLADVVIGGAVRTVLVSGTGNGGRSVFALDVTNTVDSSGTVVGPTPLWEQVPGSSNAGKAISKPSIARINLAGSAKHIAILATGVDGTSTDLGRTLSAHDLETGNPLWSFTTKCPITSDILAFETDDDLETGTPSIDGYIDRVVVADKCGYIYKLDPAQDLAGARAQSLGGIDLVIDTITTKVLFYTGDNHPAGPTPPSGDSGSRPIVGTLAARPDDSGRMVTFFGTGGLADYDVSKKNSFYAVYLDNGIVRSQELGGCNGAGECVKYYGGVVVSPTQVIFSEAIDPPIGTASCDLGSANIRGLDIQDFSSNFSIATDSATTASIYGARGAIYVPTLSGKLVQVGVPAVTEGGEDTANGFTGGSTPTANDGTGPVGVGMLGWRQIL